MAIMVHQISPVAHLPLMLGLLRKVGVAAIIDVLLPPNPAHVLSGGRGAEAVMLAILDGHHALDKAASRLEERGHPRSSSRGWSAPPCMTIAWARFSIRSVLQTSIGCLAIGLTGDPHGAHQHSRKTPRCTLSYTPSIR